MDAAGASSSTRLSPCRVEDTRQCFGGGSKELAEGAKSVKAGDWKAAEKSWEAALDSDSPTVRSQARLNLAVAAERREALDEALENARASKRLQYGGKGSEAYVRILAKRVNLAKKVAARVP